MKYKDLKFYAFTVDLSGNLVSLNIFSNIRIKDTIERFKGKQKNLTKLREELKGIFFNQYMGRIQYEMNVYLKENKTAHIDVYDQIIVNKDLVTKLVAEYLGWI